VLRHSFCSQLAMMRAAPKGIEELAGHQDITTTMRYMHLAPSSLHEAVALLDREAPGSDGSSMAAGWQQKKRQV